MAIITKKTFLWALTILVLVVFFLEFFVVIMWAPQNAETGATPTPAAAQSFTGMGYLSATITGFGTSVLIECNNSDSDAAAAIQAIPGVSVAFLASSSVIAARLNETIPAAEFAPIAARMNETLSRVCEPAIFRSAVLQATSSVNISSSDATGQSTVLYQKEIDSICQNYYTCFVDSGAAENDSIQLVASAAFQDGQLAQFIAQQISFQLTAADEQNATAEANASEEAAESAGNASAGLPATGNQSGNSSAG